jgi:hypothetical protein
MSVCESDSNEESDIKSDGNNESDDEDNTGSCCICGSNGYIGIMFCNNYGEDGGGYFY